MSDFHLQGPVTLKSPAYVERRFEQRLLQDVLANRWVLLLGPRQHGKTTALVRLRKKLVDSGMACASVDLQRMPPLDDYRSLLRWFAARLSESFASCRKTNAPSDEDEMFDWIETVVPEGKAPCVIIIDEASAIANSTWRNAFYGQIRSIASERAGNSEEGLAGRITFVFSGTFRPEELVDERNSPFNVCARIDTEDLTLDEAKRLWSGVAEGESDDFVQHLYPLVGGQPYLLQNAFSSVQLAVENEREVALQEKMRSFRLGDDDHFLSLFRKVLDDQGLTKIVSKMVRDGSIPNEPASEDFKYAQVLGVARREENLLVFRNRIYSEFAATIPAFANTSPPSSAGGPAKLVPPSDTACDFVTDTQYREIAMSSYKSAVACYNQGNYRLSLIGFGMALESVLIEWLMTLSKVDLNSKLQQAHPNFLKYENSASPDTWRLVNLEVVARTPPQAASLHIQVPSSLRDMRNLVHPARVVANYLDDKALEPEARSASGMLDAVLRDLRQIHV